MGAAYILISVLIFITCFLLVLVVLVQNSKGGGLSSTFGGTNQYMGARKTADFLEKATWTLAVVLLALSLISIFIIPRDKDVQQQSELKNVEPRSAPIDYSPAPEQE